MKRKFPIIVLVFLAAIVLVRPPALARADDPPGRKAGKAFKEMGKEFKEFGKKVGQAGKEAGLEVAEAAKKVWYKGKRVSRPMLDEVQRSTREFWAKIIEGKDRSLEELRRENAELKRRLAQTDGKQEDD